MQACIRHLVVDEHDDLETCTPADPMDFEIDLRAVVGPQGEKGDETFRFTVCSVRYIERMCLEEGAVFGCHRLVVQQYDHRKISAAVTDLVESLEAATWRELAQMLAQYGRRV